MIAFPGRLYMREELSDIDTLKKFPAVDEERRKCFRCGNTKLFGEMPCLCGKDACLYCRNCIQMGRVNSCTNLYYRPSIREACAGEKLLYWKGKLSSAQSEASLRVVMAVEKKEELLLWAVAGAGKTEILFAGIEKALQNGERVALTTPRVDVCLELQPRLEEAFPKITQCCLYGGSEDTYTGQRFVIATTHQLIRFYQAFDTIFIDEIDAFPYNQDPLLAYAVRKASKPACTNVYMTATPKRSWQRECKLARREYVKLPARYHGYALPVPKAIWVGDWQKKLKKGTLPVPVLRWLNGMVAKGKPILLFFPNITLMKKSYTIYRTVYNNSQFVYAEDPERLEKVEKLRQGKIQLLLTTTILERGVTFSDIQVGVIGAEQEIFTESALVQIAGRVGRKADYPQGDVCFFHYGKTLAIYRAISQIRNMNELAIQKGLIR